MFPLRLLFQQMACLVGNREVITQISPINIKSIALSGFMRKHSARYVSKNQSVHQAGVILRLSLDAFLIK